MNGVDEQTQALYTEQALTKVREWSYVSVAIVFELKDEDDDAGDRNANFGLLRHDGTAKPAFEAFRRGALALNTATPIDPPRPVRTLQSVEPEQPEADDPQRMRVRVWLERRARRAYARGVAEPNSVARVRAYRYLRGRQRFSRRASYTTKVNIDASGRFMRRLNKRLAQGRWRLRASYGQVV